MQSISLSLSLEEINGILNILAGQPYGTVVNLIEKIQAQANGQIQANIEKPAE